MTSVEVLHDVDTAVALIAAGHLCAIPTETVYGLAADAGNSSAIARVFEAKERPSDHPLIVHVADVSYVSEWIEELPEWAVVLVNAVWPGPLTVVGPRTQLATDEITGGQDTVAVRVPAHPLALELLKKLREQGVLGLVAPSANSFGHVSPTTAQHVVEELGAYLAEHGDAILDGGPCEVGVESTIVLATGDQPVILRPGAITQSDIERITGVQVAEASSDAPRVSGGLASHYAPTANVVLVDAEELDCLPQSVDAESAGLIALSSVSTPTGFTRLCNANTSIEFATQLYSAMREADRRRLSVIYVVAPSGTGIERAIADRLSRASMQVEGQ
jgi:L-threonylcarbamoyladenylate synthase